MDPICEAGDSVAAKLVSATKAYLLTEGIQKLSLRKITSAIGLSTTAVFSSFGSKESLVKAAIASCIDDDLKLDGRNVSHLLPIMRHSPVDGIMAYIQRRSLCQHSRAVMNALVYAHSYPYIGEHLACWHEARRKHIELLSAGSELAVQGRTFLDYLTMEELYFRVLRDIPDYRILLGTSLRALVNGKKRPVDQGTLITTWAIESAPLPAPIPAAQSSGLALQLLDAAADLLLENGLECATSRQLSTKAGTSISMMNYYFGSLEQFRDAAMKHVLTRKRSSIYNIELPTLPDDTERRQFETLAMMLMPERVGENPLAGYYPGYAKVIAQYNLSVEQRHGDTGLIWFIRSREGMVREAFAPGMLGLDREAAALFAIWMKGRCLVNSALGWDGVTLTSTRNEVSRLLDALRR